MRCGQYSGGGTPSILKKERICQIMEALRRAFSLAEDAEITIEVNPGTVDADKLAAYYAAGINRLSIGVQSCRKMSFRHLAGSTVQRTSSRHTAWLLNQDLVI